VTQCNDRHCHGRLQTGRLWSAHAGIKYLVGSIPSFFAPGASNVSERAARDLASCTRPQTHIDFLHAPLFSYQAGIHAHPVI